MAAHGVAHIQQFLSRGGPFDTPISALAFWKKNKRGTIHRVKYWEIIADDLSKAGWSWGGVSAIDSNGRTIFVADAHHGDGPTVHCSR
jgi:hypothetical protein